jgi:hypothetical protein
MRDIVLLASAAPGIPLTLSCELEEDIKITAEKGSAWFNFLSGSVSRLKLRHKASFWNR